MNKFFANISILCLLSNYLSTSFFEKNYGCIRLECPKLSDIYWSIFVWRYPLLSPLSKKPNYWQVSIFWGPISKKLSYIDEFFYGYNWFEVPWVKNYLTKSFSWIYLFWGPLSKSFLWMYPYLGSLSENYRWFLWIYPLRDLLSKNLSKSFFLCVDITI